MMDFFAELLTPTDHAGAYEWAVVFMAHMLVGMGCTALVSAFVDWLAGEWIDGAGEAAVPLVTVVYLVVWEGLFQRYGDGLADAFTDTLAVALGGLLGLFLWRRAGGKAAVVTALAALAVWCGVRARK